MTMVGLCAVTYYYRGSSNVQRFIFITTQYMRFLNIRVSQERNVTGIRSELSLDPATGPAAAPRPP